MNSPRHKHTKQDNLLAGVCSGIARATGWNVWVLRGLFVGFLVLNTFLALLVYAALAVVFHLSGEERHSFSAFKRRKQQDGLRSEELAERDRRISDLERQFRDLEGR